MEPAFGGLCILELALDGLGLLVEEAEDGPGSTSFMLTVPPRETPLPASWEMDPRFPSLRALDP